MTLGDSAVDASLIVGSISDEGGEWNWDLVEQRLDLRAIIDSLPVSSEARISPVSASTPMCSLRQDRRLRVPCFSISHSPGPHSRRPVLSTSR